MAEQLFSFSRQTKPATHTVEQLQAQVLLELADVPGQRRLRNSKAGGRLGNRAQFGNRDERSRMTQVHHAYLCRFDLKNKANKVLDDKWLPPSHCL
jgi:hypothetical protein